MPRKLRMLLAAPVLLAAVPAFAQDTTGDGTIDGTPIIVTGKGLAVTPATPAYDVQDIDREEIVATGSGRLEDALSNVAGFQQFRRSDSRSSNPSAQGVTLRAIGGNATSRAQVLLDGVPLSDPFFGYIPFNAVDPNRLGNIRVTRGGGTGPFGAGALAGTIELDSADAGELGLVQASALINDRSETELSATIAPELGNGYASLGGRWDRGKGFWTTPDDQRVPASVRAKYDSWSVGGRVVQSLGSDVTVQLRGAAWDDDRVLRFDGANTGSEGQDVSLRLVGRGDWQFDVIGYAQWRNFYNVVVSSTRFVPVLDQKDTPAEGQGGKIEIRPPVGDAHTLRLGGDFRRSAGDLFEDAYSAFSGLRTEQRFAGGVNTDFGLFAEDDWELGPVTLTGGVRADRYSIRDGYYSTANDAGTPTGSTTFANRSDWEFSWRGGAVLEIAENLKLRGAAYSGLRLPTLNELYRPFVVFPVTTLSNENLTPEKLEGWDVGFDWRPLPEVRLTATVFDNKLKDAITNVTIATNLRQRQNIDAIDASGVEFDAALKFGDFGFDGSLAYTEATQRGSGFAAALDGFRPSQTPRWAASATASWRPMDGPTVALTLRYVGKQFEDDQQTDALPSATTLNAFVEVPLFDQVSFVARAENLFDATIITRNQGGSMDLGAPRTVWGGFRFGF
ncbi:TonB-dependent receptor [Altererythrobacter salegens]|uniref:TonB-dependent receptor n=1 Tax=Croceibacterium salegens TaxID=1737568 RepID=A0A6I4SSY1_9SPHN|nr:TonB-dependent receptor [Croceibacterium salegens]MXO58995.1 TonB-dependent receptor [Croceibacterium salegens]